MLAVDGIEFSYSRRAILKEVKFEINRGEVVSLLGVNGSGKTTLLKVMNRILKPRRGATYLDGSDMAQLKGGDLAKHFAYLPQKSNGVACTVFEAILLGRKPHIKWDVSPHDVEVVAGIIDLLGLKPFSMRLTTELSGGELQMVIIGRALAQEPLVILLDEPINHLDIKNQLEVMKIIRHTVKERNIIALIAMHDINMAIRFSDAFIMLKDGTIYDHGGKEIINPESIKNVYNVDIKLLQTEKESYVYPVG